MTFHYYLKKRKPMMLNLTRKEFPHKKVPLPTSEIVAARTEIWGAVPDWIYELVDTNDIIAINPLKGKKGSFKIILEGLADRRKAFNLQKKISESLYELLTGEEFDVYDLEDRGEINRALTQQKALYNPIWNELIGDNDILNKYISYVYNETGSRGNMGIYLHDFLDFKIPTTGYISVGKLQSGSTLYATPLNFLKS